MRLTREELQIAMERAEIYPPGVPAHQWGYDFTDSWCVGEVVLRLQQDPQIVDRCCPVVAIAVHRGMQGSESMIDGTMAELLQTLKLTQPQYTNLLRDDPKAVAALFRAELEREAEL